VQKRERDFSSENSILVVNKLGRRKAELIISFLSDNIVN
jgi:hypothetical protein